MSIWSPPESYSAIHSPLNAPFHVTEPKKPFPLTESEPGTMDEIGDPLLAYPANSYWKLAVIVSVQMTVHGRVAVNSVKTLTV